MEIAQMCAYRQKAFIHLKAKERKWITVWAYIYYGQKKNECEYLQLFLYANIELFTYFTFIEVKASIHLMPSTTIKPEHSLVKGKYEGSVVLVFDNKGVH